MINQKKNGSASFILQVLVRRISTFFFLDNLFLQQGVQVSFMTHRSRKSNHCYTINQDLPIICSTFFIWLMEYRAG